MKLNVWAFALAFGIWWGVGIFLLTWWVIAFGGSTGEPTFLGRVYIGYTISPLGSVIGLIWGFVDAFIAGAIFAWLYNFIATRISPATQQQAQGSGR
ncbi:MAG: bacteriophage holin [Nitrospiraceae bacterium]